MPNFQLTNDEITLTENDLCSAITDALNAVSFEVMQRLVGVNIRSEEVANDIVGRIATNNRQNMARAMSDGQGPTAKFMRMLRRANQITMDNDYAGTGFTSSARPIEDEILAKLPLIQPEPHHHPNHKFLDAGVLITGFLESTPATIPVMLVHERAFQAPLQQFMAKIEGRFTDSVKLLMGDDSEQVWSVGIVRSGENSGHMKFDCKFPNGTRFYFEIKLTVEKGPYGLPYDLTRLFHWSQPSPPMIYNALEDSHYPAELRHYPMRGLKKFIRQLIDKHDLKTPSLDSPKQHYVVWADLVEQIDELAKAYADKALVQSEVNTFSALHKQYRKGDIEVNQWYTPEIARTTVKLNVGHIQDAIKQDRFNDELQIQFLYGEKGARIIHWEIIVQESHYEVELEEARFWHPRHGAHVSIHVTALVRLRDFIAAELAKLKEPNETSPT